MNEFLSGSVNVIPQPVNYINSGDFQLLIRLQRREIAQAVEVKWEFIAIVVSKFFDEIRHKMPSFNVCLLGNHEGGGYPETIGCVAIIDCTVPMHTFKTDRV